MAAIPLIETETKQICSVCGKEYSGKFDHKINGETHKGVCFSCIKKERFKIYINNPGTKEREKERQKKYLDNPKKMEKHKESMKKYHERTRPDRIKRGAVLRGLEADVFINQPFSGSEAHHIDKKTVVYIPNWLHSSLPHQHKKPETMVIINKWSDRWVQLEEAHKDETLKT
ncbi:MAG: hypothetical protein OIN90_14420, partial [Candidatus Methanoperedens sp.]|nr:hypothetical protein [Candidatus Methanoperedens sp.]